MPKFLHIHKDGPGGMCKWYPRAIAQMLSPEGLEKRFWLPYIYIYPQDHKVDVVFFGEDHAFFKTQYQMFTEYCLQGKHIKIMLW